VRATRINCANNYDENRFEKERTPACAGTSYRNGWVCTWRNRRVRGLTDDVPEGLVTAVDMQIVAKEKAFEKPYNQ
jgi:hypothetical protein